MNLVARVILLTAATLLTACASITDSTSPVSSRARAILDCNTQEGCDLSPTISSISPTTSVYPVPYMVCIYGTNLNLFQGRVFYDGVERPATADGCGAGTLFFVAPILPSGQVPLYVVTDFGTSNTVYFTRH